MNTFEPGRVYSGIVDGKRQIVFCDSEHWHHVDAAGVLCGGGHFNGSYTDVRGPLVVLDLPDLDDVDWRTIATDLRNRTASADAPYARIADQIEEQTRPQPQVGVHLVERGGGSYRTYMGWDGNRWCYGNGVPSAWQDWTSTHYIGPGSGDAS